MKRKVSQISGDEMKRIKNFTTVNFNKWLSNLTLLRDQPFNLSLGENYDEENMSNEVQKIDSVHDFGSTRGNNLATDSVSKIKDNSTTYAYNAMTLFFIQKYSFPPIADNWCSTIQKIPIQLFSNFSFPGNAPLQRAVNDVEDYCLFLALKQRIKNADNLNNFLFETYDKKDTVKLSQIKDKISDFFSNYNDTSGTGKINFLVDTPGDLTKVLKSNKSNDGFAYIILQESANDSAKGKPTSLEPEVINTAYNGNGFCEMFGIERTYNPGITGISVFESNYKITLKGMNYKSIGSKENFETDVEYTNGDEKRNFKCILNSLVHPTNVPSITKAVGNIIKGNDLKLNPESKNILDDKTINVEEKINNFYTNFDANPLYNYSGDNPKLLDFNFTKKRAGDGLQARVCQYINESNPIMCYKMGTVGVGSLTPRQKGGLFTGTEYAISKLILVTIDRVLFSYCVKNGIPAIYAGKGCFLFFNPLKNISVISGGKNKMKHSSSKKQLPIPSINKEINQKGGNDAEGIKKMEEFFTEIPYCLFKLLPKIINTNQGQPEMTHVAINYVSSINDSEIQTVYSNGEKCLYKNEYVLQNSESGLNILPDNYLIWLEDDNIRLTVKKLSSNDFIFTFKKSTTTTLSFGFDVVQILGIINEEIRFLRSGTSEFIRMAYDVLPTITEGSDENDSIRGGGPDNKIPSLDIYYTLFFQKKQISLEPISLEKNNILTIISYFNLFSRYETMLCCDNEEYYQSFTTTENELEITTNIELYVLFKILLDDFESNKHKICYGLLEYFLNTGDEDNTFFNISDDLERIIYYLFCDYKILGTTVNVIVTGMINENKIDKSSQIFLNTADYFKQLFERVSKEVDEIESRKNIAYIKKYLSIYGFMNMIRDFEENLKPETKKQTVKNQVSKRSEKKKTLYTNSKQVNPERKSTKNSVINRSTNRSTRRKHIKKNLSSSNSKTKKMSNTDTQKMSNTSRKTRKNKGPILVL